ncbi:MAG TPA: Crp/Fnr family transcriptional regulator [Xanthobacteraceae bacterium]|nr:Crp/Fnr family transcriptional regulator [Xanthobacteraceae bacterium]
MLAEDWATIARAPIFRAMDETLLRSVIRNREPRRYGRGETIFQQGDPADAFFLVLDGWVKLYRAVPNGDEIVVALFTKGETFAEAMMFRGGCYPACAEAVSPVRLLRVDGRHLRDAIMKNPQISLEMLAAASLHLRQLVEQIEQLKAQSAPKRIAWFLLSLTTARCGPVEIALPYEKTLIANRLGMKPESFSRALARLRAFGVEVDRDRVRIADVRNLLGFVADGDPTAASCRVLVLRGSCPDETCKLRRPSAQGGRRAAAG